MVVMIAGFRWLRPVRRITTMLLLAVLVLGCGGTVPESTVEADRWVTTASGLRYQELEPGDGRPAQTGDVVRVHYTGWLLVDGTRGRMVDSSVGKDPIQFTLGAGQVIRGWEEGLRGLNEGGKRELIIPPELAYGQSGAAGVTPPGATLAFEVELVQIVSR